jgi:hypothetical protein
MKRCAPSCRSRRTSSIAFHVDGTSPLDRPAQERFDALAAALPPALVIPRIVTADVAAAEDFYADAWRAATRRDG